MAYLRVLGSPKIRKSATKKLFKLVTHKRGLETHMNHFCAIVLTQMFCGMAVKKKLHFLKNSSCNPDRCTAGDVCVCVSLG